MTTVPVVLGAASRRELLALADTVAAAEPADLTGYARDLAGRTHPGHRHRAVLLVRRPAELRAAPGAARAADPATAPCGPLAFLFAGQSSQRTGMGEQLGREFAEFDRIVERVCAHADPVLPAPLRAAIAGDAPQRDGWPLLDHGDVAQPALLAVGLGLVRLLEIAGIAPDVVAGHSFGECVAAAAADVWTLDDACAVVLERGRLLGGLPPGGGMMAIEAAEEEVTAALPAGVAISAVHGPSSVVIAGPLGTVRAVAVDFVTRGVGAAPLTVTNAYHTAAVDPVLAPLAAALATIPARPARVPLVGNATGAEVPPGDPATPEHWTRHCRRAVRWSAVLDTLRRRSVHSYLEIGPSGVLSRLSTGCLGPQYRDAVIPALQAEPDEPAAFLGALARLDARGHPVNWPAVFAASSTLRG